MKKKKTYLKLFFCTCLYRKCTLKNFESVTNEGLFTARFMGQTGQFDDKSRFIRDLIYILIYLKIRFGLLTLFICPNARLSNRQQAIHAMRYAIFRVENSKFHFPSLPELNGSDPPSLFVLHPFSSRTHSCGTAFTFSPRTHRE